MLNLVLKKKSSALVASGYPWIFKGDFETTSLTELAEAGELARVSNDQGKILGIAYFNPHARLAGRMLAGGTKQEINQEFFVKLIQRALKKRSVISENFYRLLFSEADFVPGLVVDRFGDYLSVQITTAGMWRLKDIWLAALEEVLKPKGTIIDHDNEFCQQEKVPLGIDIIGSVPDVVEVRENGRSYFANLKDGQKTGWFFDQRANREYLKTLAKDASVLDLYTHSGGFALAALDGGAKNVTLVDSSELGLSLAQKAMNKAGFSDKCSFERDKVFDFFEKYNSDKKYDIVNADPPAFVKNKKDIHAGLKGYEKLTKLCLSLVKENGIFAITSCSHHARPDLFRQAVAAGIKKSGRKAKLIHKAGADFDHPLHPLLPENEYLKFLVFQMD